MARLTQYECDACGSAFTFRGEGRPNYGDGLMRCERCRDNFTRSIRHANQRESLNHYPHNRSCSCTSCFYDRLDAERPGHNF